MWTTFTKCQINIVMLLHAVKMLCRWWLISNPFPKLLKEFCASNLTYPFKILWTNEHLLTELTNQTDLDSKQYLQSHSFKESIISNTKEKKFFFLNYFFLSYLFWEREREIKQGWGRERGRERIPHSLHAVSTEPNAGRSGAWSREPWDHDLSQNPGSDT